MSKESEIIKNFFLPLASNKESMGLLNDGALIQFAKNEKVVISSDMMIENQHFDKNFDPKLLAKKLLRVNLSDIAAMGAKPYGYLLNLAIPKKKHLTWLSLFVQGLKEDQKKFGLKLFGGDLSNSSVIFLSATILGKVKKNILMNKYAKAGSDIFVSGYLGDSAITFDLIKRKKIKNIDAKFKKYLIKRHFLPEPKIKLGMSIINIAEACTDISDGLIGDIKKISQQSNLCANIFCEKIPLSPPVKNILSLSKNKKKIWESILIGGEDYELVFSVAKTKIKKLSNLKEKIQKIGFFSKGNGIKVFDSKGKILELNKESFSHF